MNQEETILANIREAIEEYEDMELEDILTQSNVLRKLSSNLFYLEAYRVKAHDKWQSVRFNSSGKSEAAKEREADFKVPELYMYRRLMSSGHKQADAIRSIISVYKKEN